MVALVTGALGMRRRPSRDRIKGAFYERDILLNRQRDKFGRYVVRFRDFLLCRPERHSADNTHYEVAPSIGPRPDISLASSFVVSPWRLLACWR